MRWEGALIVLSSIYPCWSGFWRLAIFIKSLKAENTEAVSRSSTTNRDTELESVVWTFCFQFVSLELQATRISSSERCLHWVIFIIYFSKLNWISWVVYLVQGLSVTFRECSVPMVSTKVHTCLNWYSCSFAEQGGRWFQASTYWHYYSKINSFVSVETPLVKVMLKNEGISKIENASENGEVG